MTGSSTPMRGHALVIGASVAGLMAARALSAHYASVTLVERDEVADAVGPRKGVPQSRHAHGLLAGGREAAERLFPGFTADLLAGGALQGDLLADSRWFGHGIELARRPSGLVGLLASRPLIEAQIRRRVAALPNVTLLAGRSVCALAADETGKRVVGVRLDGGEDVLAADLVVDATGRGSRSPAWLEGLGYAAAPEEAIDVGICYTTRIFERRAAKGAPIAVVVGASAPHWRFGVALAMEGDRWIVTLGGYFGDAAPSDEDGFLAFARTIETPALADLIAGARPVSDFAGYRFPGSRRRRYERLQHFPQGYLVFGDALCSFNPIYGQGMTSAILQAEALDLCLAQGQGQQGQEQLARRFFAAAAGVIDTPWQMAAGADVSHPRLAGQAGWMQRLMNGYIVQLYRSAARDASLAAEFLTVANLMQKPSRLFAPSVAWAVAKGALQRRPASDDAAGALSYRMR